MKIKVELTPSQWHLVLKAVEWQREAIGNMSHLSVTRETEQDYADYRQIEGAIGKEIGKDIE